MGDRTAIPWADATWNPVSGCSPVSDGCSRCYASRQIRSGRTPAVHGSKDFEKVMFHPNRLDIPLRWKKPRRIFVCSMGDFWHPDVPPIQRALVLDRIKRCPQHTFFLLTKRAKEMFEDTTDNTMIMRFFPLPNVIGMVTAENQEAADERIPWLLKVPFTRRGVSVEPCLGPVNLAGWGSKMYLRTIGRDGSAERPGLDWCIVGGESGPGARPLHPDWPRSLRDQCQAGGVPFFFKGWGEWGPGGGGQLYHRGSKVHQWSPPSGAVSIRVGKKSAGCLLDGREHKDIPHD